MKSFGKLISKSLLRFIGYILLLAFLNIIGFMWTFHDIVKTDYSTTAPPNMLAETISNSDSQGISQEMSFKLQENQVWAMFLNENGLCQWTVNLPEEIPQKYSIQDVAVFSKGYIKDYPVFVRIHENGLLVLGYPQNSYTKLINNYYPISIIKIIAIFFVCIFTFDFLFIFIAFYLSKSKIIKYTEPIISSIEMLSEGKPTDLCIKGELSDISNSINKASAILNNTNIARANWISGISHDIRTPLSIIMGYATRISDNSNISTQVKEQSNIILNQGIKIKELIYDLNLVSQLEYDVQPLHKESTHLSKLLRSIIIDILNNGLPDIYSIEINISDAAETISIELDIRLITRAITNLVHNCIQHNPNGCDIVLSLDLCDNLLSLIIADNGIGISPEKMQELATRPHYMESTDERLDLRHGLGIVLVRQIIQVHHGTLEIKSEFQKGYKTTIKLPI